VPRTPRLVEQVRIATNTARISESLSGAMNGETTLVAISEVPRGQPVDQRLRNQRKSSFW
jgi:hypothetical protein